jgi:hypothetical protein
MREATVDSIEVLSAEMRQAVSDAAAAVLPDHDPMCAINDGQVWCDCAVIARVREDERRATLSEVHKWVMRLPYEIDGEIWIDRDDVEAIIERLRREASD